MLTTWIRALGMLVLMVASAVSMRARKVSTGVMAASEVVQASLAPMRIVTNAVPCAAAASTWAGRASDRAPVLAKL